MRTVIFDLDGTLADTSADLIAAANACFRNRGAGAPLDPACDAHTAFRGGRAMLRLGFARLGEPEPADLDAEYRTLLTYYGAHIAEETRLYPGALAALERLAAQGYALGICTNKPVDHAGQLLEALGIRDRFAALIGAGSLPVRKPDPAPLRAAVDGAGGDLARTLLVGDTETDRATARAAGVPCALVTFGPDGDGVAALDPEALLDRFDDLDAVVARLIG